MGTIINIETSTEVCSVALTSGDEVLWHKENYDGQSHSVLLAKYLEEMMEWCKSNGMKPQAVAVSCGPGSYTGLRIGVSTAKGLCYGLDVPLIAVPTLQLMSSSVLSKVSIVDDALLCPMIDARRMEVYTAFYDKSLNIKGEVRADIIDERSYLDCESDVFFFGNGASKCREVLSRPNFKYVDAISPLAADMAKISSQMYAQKKFVDVAYFEPFYLKDFVATVPKNKVLGEIKK